MQLWLQGPQSLEALGELAVRFAAVLAAGEAPPPAPPLRLDETTELQLAVDAQPALWRCPLIALSDNVTLLREFLLDEAPGSLMAGLRQRGQAQEVALNWLYQDRHLGWLALVFASDQPEQVDRQITHWLQALQRTTPDQQQHYYQLSRRRFQALSPLDQLRQRAFGFAPGAPPVGFADFCAALQAAPTVSLACETLSPGEPVATQGFSLPLSRWRRRPVTAPALKFAFYPQAAGGPCGRKSGASRAAAPPPVTGRAAEAPAPTALLLLAHSGRGAGARGTAAPAARRAAPRRGPRRVASLRRQLAAAPAVASCRPAAGGYSAGHRAAARAPGRPADPAAGEYCYPSSHGPAPRTVGHIRASGWLAGGPGRRQRGGCAVGRAPAEPAYRPGQPAGQPPRPLPARRQTAGFPRGDTALLVFIPLPDGASLAALRVLAQRCEPLFFQRLRVEQQIGYVVSCRYQRVADRDGLLMALQSPDRRAVELLRCCKTFLRQLPPLDEAAFRPLQQRLAAQVRARTPPEAQALVALRQKYALPELTAQAADALRVEAVVDLAHEMSRRRRRWRVLFTAGD